VANEPDINQILQRLDYLEKLVQRHNHDGVETVELDDIVSGLTSPLTTKGDVWGYSGTDARIPIGANGDVLTADSTQALGLKWAAPASSSFVSPLTTKGDIHTFTTVDARLGVGSDGQTLYADSAQATGLRWGSPAAIGLTTKGDILCYSSAIDRLPVGSNGKILSADSGESTGLKWITSTTTGFTSRVNAYLGSDQSHGLTGFEKVQFATENFDGDGEYSVSDYKFTAGSTGYYLVISKVTTNRANDSANDVIAVFKNNSATSHAEYFVQRSSTGSYTPFAKVEILMYLIAGDYIDIRVNLGSYSTPKILSGEGATFLHIHRLS